MILNYHLMLYNLFENPNHGHYIHSLNRYNEAETGSQAYRDNKLEIKQKYHQCLSAYGLDDQLPKAK